MATVLIHATITLDGYMADDEGDVSWMNDFDAAAEDFDIVQHTVSEIGAVVAGANPSQTIVDGEEPYGGLNDVPVFLMTHRHHEPIMKDGVTYHFVVDDIGEAVQAAKLAAGDGIVSLLGGKIARQCLKLGLVDEIRLDVVPVLLGSGISLFGGLGERINLDRIETVGYASESHLRFRVVKS